jgi:hypothetical protein
VLDEAALRRPVGGRATMAEPMDPGLVYVETRAGSLYLEGRQVREYNTIFQHWWPLRWANASPRL